MAGEVDLDALRGFIDESNDSMQTIEADFIELENDPSNREIINRIFRPVHSLKGNSGFFGLTNINKFSHRLENLLDAARNGELLISREIIDVLLTGIDYLRKMLERATADPTDTALRPAEQDFLAGLERYKPQEMAGSIQSVLDLETLLHSYLDLGYSLQDNSLIVGLLGQIAKANDAIRKLLAEQAKPAEKSAFSADLLYFHAGRDYTAQVRPFGQVFESLTAGKPLEPALLQHFSLSLQGFGTLFKDNAELAKEIDELMSLRNFMDDELMAANEEFTVSARRLLNRVLTTFERKHVSGDSQKLGEILLEQGLVSQEQIEAALGKQKKIGELLVEEGAIAKEDLEKALTIQNKRVLDAHLKQGAPAESIKTIRIDQDKLDSFANSVGELFIGLDSVNYVRKLLEEAAADFALISRFDSAVATLDERVERLHDNIMNIRRVPVKNLFQRFPRVVRQLAASLGKEIRFREIGEDTVIDKDLLETIENPLVHILRNSVDHGLETPEVRKQKGKVAEGLLELIASSDENNVYITIRDDGQGIDPMKMKESAIKKGFLTRQEAEHLSENELINLIFKPGFSTAEKVSDVSGRGVGMDVVMAGLRASNGAIQVDSAIGTGTTVRLTIPLTKTLVTKEAMIAEAGGQKYVIPSDDITTVIETDNIIPLLAADNCISYDNAILRLIDLNRFFYPPRQTEPDRPEGRQVIIVCKEHQIALRVDHIISHQKVVAKDFAGGYQRLRQIEGVCGYTILGNEDIILIVDVKEIAEHAT
ncbi:MAG: chemotaxis protein CheA [Thermodesulfobacteriota bacterium]